MGDTFDDGGKDEKPVHKTCVNDFYLEKHEVMQSEWIEIMGDNPSHFKDCGDNCPVENVSWNDIQKFFSKINRQTGMNYRLPTEAEWEFAARERGKKVRFGTGKDFIASEEANIDGRSKYKKSYSRIGVNRERTLPVKSFSPNKLGLYDMAGNVWEWVYDRYGRKYYSNSSINNPQGPESGTFRTMRGGSWRSQPKHSRASFRFYSASAFWSSGVGFRIAHDAPGRK